MAKYEVALRVEFLSVTVEASSVEEAMAKAVKGEFLFVDPIPEHRRDGVEVHWAGKAARSFAEIEAEKA